MIQITLKKKCFSFDFNIEDDKNNCLDFFCCLICNSISNDDSKNYTFNNDIIDNITNEEILEL
jgi:hypothetical protein